MSRLLATLWVLAAAQASAQVTQVIGATQEVHGIASVGDQVVLATSGGIVAVGPNAGPNGQATRTTSIGTRMRSVSVTPSGVWVGGVEGLVRLDDTLRPMQTLPIRRVRRVVEWANATWIVGYAGLRRIEGANETALDLGRSHARSRLTDAIVVPVRLPTGTIREELWVGSAGAGILRVASNGSLLGRIHRGLPDATVWALMRRGDEIVVGTLDGVGVVVNAEVQRAHALTRAGARLPIRDVRALAITGEHVAVATFGGGVFRLDDRPRQLGRPSNALALAATSRGLVVGHGRGADRIIGTRATPLLRGRLPSADVTALERAFGSLWIGTFDRGLARMRNGEVEAVRAARERWNVDGRINDLAVTRRGGERLWIATDRGLYWHDGRRFSEVEDARSPGRVHVTSLHVDARGRLWATSSRQLSRWTGGTWQSWGGDPRFPLMQLHAVTTIGDEVWVGSLHGLFRLDPATGRYDRHTVSSGDLPVDWVTALTRTGGRLVAGTYHGGLAWRTGTRFRPEREADGLPAGWVNPHAMKTIGRELWIGTLERGLVIGRRGRWRHLTMADGLPSNDVTDFLPEGDGVWVATRGGLALLSQPTTTESSSSSQSAPLRR